jgi:glutathione peroxidase
LDFVLALSAEQLAETWLGICHRIFQINGGPMNNNFHDYTVKKINGTPVNLADYKGKALLVVNVASECGLTPQYEALEKVYEKYHENGLEILGFPANEFGAQEPGTNSEIQDFCVSKFGVKFPMFEKIVVKGEGQHPLYNFLTNIKPDAQKVNGDSFEEKLKTYGITRENKKDILWNFEKFLINKKGEVIARFAPDVTPDDAIVTKAIESALN